jgi:hypothetical protein
MKQITLSSEVRHLIYNQTVFISKIWVFLTIAFGIIAGLFLAIYIADPDPEFLIGTIIVWVIFLSFLSFILVRRKKAAFIKNSDGILVYEAVVVDHDDPRAAGMDLADKSYSILFEKGDENNSIGKASFYHIHQKIKAKPGTMVVIAKFPNKEQLYAFPFAR